MSKRKLEELEELLDELPKKEAKIEESPYKFDVFLNGTNFKKFKLVMTDESSLKVCVDNIIDLINKDQPDTIPKSKYNVEIKCGDYSIDTEQQVGKISKKNPEVFKIYISFSKLVTLKIFVDDIYKKEVKCTISDNQKFENLLPLIKRDLMDSDMWVEGTDFVVDKCHFYPMRNNSKIVSRTNSFESIKNGEQIEVRAVTEITSYYRWAFPSKKKK